MTVSSSNTREVNIEKLVKNALFLAQLIPAGAPTTGVQWTDLSGQAKELLDMKVKSLQGANSMPRHVELFDVELVVGQSAYTMPVGTLEIFGDAYHRVGEITDSGFVGDQASTLVKIIERQTYVGISDKTSAGIPCMYWSSKGVPLVITIWPVPDRLGVLTVQRERIIADSNDGTKTVELESYWSEYLTLEVAHLMALYNPALAGYLRTRAGEALKAATSRAAQTAPSQIVVSHQTGWEQ